jgi:peptidoglycan/LPS O-acetylase OafA/YrhL
MRDRIDGIHVLRGFATVSVVVSHVGERYMWQYMSAEQISSALIASHFVIYLFFAISGMIIVYTSLNSFGKEGASKDFLIRRLVRVIPLYYIATFVEFTTRAITHKPAGLTALLCSLLFIPYPTSSAPETVWRPVLGVAWTLDYEILFYLVFAACLLFSRKTGMRVLSAALIVLVIAGTPLKSPFDVEEPRTLFTIWTNPIFLVVLLGAIIGNNIDTIRKFEIRPQTAVGVAGGILLLVATLCVMWGGAPYTLAERGVLWIAVLAILCLAITARNMPDGAIRSTGILLGDASYSIFLFHFFFIVLIEKIWRAVGGPPNLVVYFLSGVAGSVLLGIGVYYVLEKPLSSFTRDALRSGFQAAWSNRSQYTPTVFTGLYRLVVQSVPASLRNSGSSKLASLYPGADAEARERAKRASAESNLTPSPQAK